MMKRFALAVALGIATPHAVHAWTFDWAGHVEVDAAGLESDDPQKRLDAVGDLAKYDITLTQKYLIKALSDDDEKVKQAAAKALGAGGSLAAVPLMIEWLSALDTMKRQVAAGALGDIGGNEATAALI